MGSNFSDIGVEDEAIAAFAERSIDVGEPVPASEGVTYRWFEPSGAGVFTHVEGEEIVCVTPVHRPEANVRLRYDGYLRDPECDYCSAIQVAVVEDGEMLFPFNIQVADIEVIRRRLPDEGSMVDVALTFFGQDVSCFTDEGAFQDEQSEEEVAYASQSFIPAGMFGGTPSSAILTCIVRSAERRTNTISGRDYIVARAETLGMLAHLVLDPADFDHDPAPGNVLSGHFRAHGTVEAGLLEEPRKRSFWDKIFGRR